MPLPRYQYFSPSDAARVSKLQFAARQVVEGIISGQHKSPHRGFSVEFSEHREYSRGDELRHLDWRALARSDRYYIKLYEQETNLRATLLLDTSGSMNFGNKLDYARHLAGCMAYLLAHQQDLAGLVAADESIRVELPPGSSPVHLDRLFRELEKLSAQGHTHLPQKIHELAERLPRRSLVILISDLWTDPAELLRALRHLRYRKHQGLILHLLDDTELTLQGAAYDKQVTLQDLETNEKIQIDPRSLGATYRQQVQDYLASLRRAASDCDVEYHPINTREPYDRALVQLLARRR